MIFILSISFKFPRKSQFQFPIYNMEYQRWDFFKKIAARIRLVIYWSIQQERRYNVHKQKLKKEIDTKIVTDKLTDTPVNVRAK